MVSCLIIPAVLNNLQWYQAIDMNFRNAAENCPVHEVEGEESQGECDSRIPLDVAATEGNSIGFIRDYEVKVSHFKAKRK